MKELKEWKSRNGIISLTSLVNRLDEDFCTGAQGADRNLDPALQHAIQAMVARRLAVWVDICQDMIGTFIKLVNANRISPDED